MSIKLQKDQFFKHKLCRLCENNDNLFNIFEEKSIDVMKVRLCVNLEIEENDLLPKWICNDCKLKIETLHNFQIQCKKIDDKFREMIKHASKNIEKVKDEHEFSIEPNLLIENETDDSNCYDSPVAENDCTINVEIENKSIIDNTETSFYTVIIKEEHDEQELHSITDEMEVQNLDEITDEMEVHDLAEITDEMEIQDLAEKAEVVEKITVKIIHNCEICNKCYNSKRSYAAHMLLHNKNFKCEICKKTFARPGLLEEHNNVHTGEYPYECNECDKKFNFRANLYRHRKEVHIRLQPHVCNICGKTFGQKVSLQTHEAVHITTKNVECDICKKKFKTKFILNKHKRIHLPPGARKDLKSYMCSYCGKKCAALPMYTAHLRTHTGEKPFECNTCGEKFGTKLSLKNHSNIHIDYRPYKCEECGNKFRQQSHLKLHRRIHTGERPYPCLVCEKAFKAPRDLVLHTRIHTGERPFACELCSMKFIDKRNLKRHMKKTHEDSDS